MDNRKQESRNITWNIVMNKYGMIAIAAICLQGCEKAPECNYTGAEIIEANAACLVVHNHKLLLVEGHNGALSLPGGGLNKGETSQCTAEREVWEETGIKVKANELVDKFDNGLYLYSCSIINPEVQTLDGSKRTFRQEVAEVHWLGLEDFDNKNWRFPDRVGLMKRHLIEHGKLD